MPACPKRLAKQEKQEQRLIFPGFPKKKLGWSKHIHTQKRKTSFLEINFAIVQRDVKGKQRQFDWVLMQLSAGLGGKTFCFVLAD